MTFALVFVEELINRIVDRTRNLENIDTGKLMVLLIELDNLRSELECKAQESSGQKC